MQENRIPIDEVRKLAGRAIKEDMDILQALADYDRRHLLGYGTIIVRMGIQNFITSTASMQFRTILKGEDNVETNSQNLVNFWTSYVGTAPVRQPTNLGTLASSP